MKRIEDNTGMKEQQEPLTTGETILCAFIVIFLVFVVCVITMALFELFFHLHDLWEYILDTAYIFNFYKQGMP